jgi:TetR/AcrR family tetracycline transcriptional repressor
VVKLTRDRIVDASMAVLAEVGYDGLAMRRVADRLDARVGSLYYHVRDKNALLRLMADRVTRQAHDAATTALAALPADATWQDRVHVQAGTLRHTLLSHRGGAQLLAGSPQTLSTGALGLMERLLATLRDAGVPSGDRIVAADTILSHITGFVLQEQTESAPSDVRPEDIAELAERFPLTFAEAPGGDQNTKFARSIRLLCAAVGANQSRAGGTTWTAR